MTSENYVSRKFQLLKNFDKAIARVKPVLISRYGEEQANTLIRESRQEYEDLIPQIPYIVDKSPFLIFLLPTTHYLAIYRALKRHGRTGPSVPRNFARVIGPSDPTDAGLLR